MGFKEKNDAPSQQMMTDDALAVYFQQEQDIKAKVEEAQATLDGLKIKIKEANESIDSLDHLIEDAEKELSDFKTNLQDQKNQLKKELEVYNHAQTDEIEAKKKLNAQKEADNRKESDRLIAQKQDQDTREDVLIQSEEALSEAKKGHKSLCDKQNSEVLSKKKELEGLIKQNQALLEQLKSENTDRENQLVDIKAQLATLTDVEKQLAENKATLDSITTAQAALDQRKIDLDLKESNLKTSAEAQDSVKDQIQLRSDSLDQREEDLRNRERIVQQKESNLTK